MKNKIFNMIKRALITLAGKDEGDFLTAQVSYFGKTKQVEIMLPYGLYANPGADSIAVVFNVNGQEENQVAIPYDPYGRFKDLEPGEVAVGNIVKGSKITFKANGDIDIESAGNININSADKVNINGDTEPLVRGVAMTTLFNLHTHNETGAVTAPPNQPMGTTEVSSKNFTE